MKTLDKVKAVVTEGSVLVTVENTNTYRPMLNGSRRRVTKVGATFFDYEMLDGKHKGEKGHSYFPARASDVLAVDESSVSFALSKDGHHVTLRKEA